MYALSTVHVMGVCVVYNECNSCTWKNITGHHWDSTAGHG
jgi:hypothetical protein